jgi:hypothetical protein
VDFLIVIIKPIKGEILAKVVKVEKEKSEKFARLVGNRSLKRSG